MTATLRHWWFGDDRDNRWVVPLAVGLVVAELAFRAWASFGSWWNGDDFIMIARVFGPGGTTVPGLLAGFAGHVMPGGFYLTWLLTKMSPYDYALPAASLLAMQALADVGLLRLLMLGFGRRWGILPPLIAYLATSYTVGSAVWWATGVQALPVQIAFFWAMSSQVTYLRTRRPLAALAALAWVGFALLFYEKAILVIGALAIVTVAYFTQGTARQRLRQVWTRYRVSVLASLVLGVGYLAVYVHYGLNFAPATATHVPIGPTADVMVLRGWGPVALGGPLRWRHDPTEPISYANPPSIVVLLAWVCLVLLIREIARSRSCSLRALCLPGFFLVSDLLLVTAGRAAVFGPAIGFEYRYITELSAVTATALAFATMPVRGAVEEVQVVRPSALLDRRRTVAIACAAVAALGTFSASTFVHNWHRDMVNRAYMTHLVHDARTAPAGTQVVDAAVAPEVVFGFAHPNNLLSRLLAPVDRHLRYVTAATDQLAYPSTDGHLRQISVLPTRHVVSGSTSGCANRLRHGVRTLRLDAPFALAGGWVRVSYLATADSSITVSAGGVSHRTSITSGLHVLYFSAGDQPFDSITLGDLIGEAQLCTDNVIVGQPALTGGS
ncbi:hypothetical protein [Nocardioides cynanchi]|uniref:hypothetical protein n=1 Tax=Nocardioides cynanchi TaxID=2558918 RepID=UPI0017867BA4|nr:hypothetical protein [Nocardioides cynanchi]